MEPQLNKYNAIPLDCTISGKISTSPTKPCKSYIEVVFNTSFQGFSFFVFQNFYTFAIAIKTLKTGANPDSEESWTTVY